MRFFLYCTGRKPAQCNASRAIVIFVTIIFLLNAMVPTLAHAATYLQGSEVNALVRDAYVQVTYLDNKKEQQVAKGWIDAIGETTFTIRSGGVKSKTVIAYDKVISVVMSDESTVPAKQMNEVNRFVREMREMRERNRNYRVRTDHSEVLRKTVTIMSRGQIDSSKIIEGWYAYVVYTSEKKKETVAGWIGHKDATHISSVKTKITNWRDRKSDWTIAYTDIDTLIVAKRISDINRYRVSGVQYNTKVRLISRKKMVGKFVKIKKDTLVLQEGRAFYQVPLSSISMLEVSRGQRRYIFEGLLIGVGVGGVVVVLFDHEAQRLSQQNSDSLDGLVTAIAGRFFGGCVLVLSTLIGAMIKSDKWVEVSPQYFHLTLGPLSAGQAGTPTKGLRAGLTFNF